MLSAVTLLCTRAELRAAPPAVRARFIGPSEMTAPFRALPTSLPDRMQFLMQRQFYQRATVVSPARAAEIAAQRRARGEALEIDIGGRLLRYSEGPERRLVLVGPGDVSDATLAAFRAYAVPRGGLGPERLLAAIDRLAPLYDGGVSLGARGAAAMATLRELKTVVHLAEQEGLVRSRSFLLADDRRNAIAINIAQVDRLAARCVGLDEARCFLHEAGHALDAIHQPRLNGSAARHLGDGEDAIYTAMELRAEVYANTVAFGTLDRALRATEALYEHLGPISNARLRASIVSLRREGLLRRGGYRSSFVFE